MARVQSAIAAGQSQASGGFLSNLLSNVSQVSERRRKERAAQDKEDRALADALKKIEATGGQARETQAAKESLSNINQIAEEQRQIATERRAEITAQQREDRDLEDAISRIKATGKQQRLTEREKIRLKGTPVGGILDGTPAGAIGTTERRSTDTSIMDTFEKRPTDIVPEAETFKQTQGILGQAGLQPRGRTITVDPETGEQVFIPETGTEAKVRLQVEKLQRESTPEGRIALAKEESRAKAQQQAEAQAAKEAEKAARTSRAIKAKLKLTFNRFLAATEGGKKAGRIAGFISTAKGKLGINAAFKDFEGTLVESSTAVAKAAAPSAKIGPDIIKMFGTTLPSVGFFTTATVEEAINQIATSTTQGFINFATTHPEDFPEEPDFELFRQQQVDILTKIAKEAEETNEDNSLKNGITSSGIKFTVE